MKISVVVIGYNIEKYVHQCMKTILNQTYKDLEVIFVDDGSKDNTRKEAEQFLYDHRVKVYTKENGGIVSARKYGVTRATGEYITFVDGDDWLNIEMIENLCLEISAGESHPDIVSSNMLRQKADGNFIIKGNNCAKKECSGFEYFNLIMSDQVNHHMFPKLYKREFVLRAGYLDYPDVTMGEDLMTNAFFGLYQPYVIFSDSVNYYYRFNANSVMRKGDNTLLRQIKTLEYIDEKVASLGYSRKFKELLDYQWVSYAFNYVNERVDSHLKYGIVNAVRERITGALDNHYTKVLFDSHPRYAVARFKAYMNVPFIMNIFDPLALHGKDGLSKFYWTSKSKKYQSEKKKLAPYYSKLTDRIEVKDPNKTAFLIGTSDRSNIGDHAIAYAEAALIRKWLSGFDLIEITGDHYRNQSERIEAMIPEESTIFITGGGFLGDLWMDEENLVRDVIKSFPLNKIVILPQTIFFNDIYGAGEYRLSSKIYRSHKHLRLLVRDKNSLRIANDLVDKDSVRLFPDMALFTEINWNYTKQNESCIFCFREDKEGIITDKEKQTLTEILGRKGLKIEKGSTLKSGQNNGDILLENRKDEIRNKIEEFSRAKLIITDRLHGMILSMLAGTPCIAFDNSSHKVEGVYSAWLTGIKYVKIARTNSEFENMVDELIAMGHQQYTTEYLDNELKKMTTFIQDFVLE